MTPLSGFFDPVDDHRAAGFIKARVGIPRAASVLDVTFMIDTGCHASVLLDEDFLAAINAVAARHGVAFISGNAALRWVATRPEIFGAGDDIWSVGGPASCYLLKHSWIWLCDQRGLVPPQTAPVGPVRGAFSYGFLNPPGPTCRSLLGRNELSALQRMVWARPKALLTLHP